MAPTRYIPTTVGAILIGGLFATLFAGMTNLQTMLYYRTYKKDPVPVKSLVFCVWLLDNLHTGFVWATLWHCLIEDYGQPEKINIIPWCIALTLLTELLTFLVHCFLAHRIFLLSKKNLFMTLPALVLTFIRLGASSASTWAMLHFQDFSLFQKHASWIFTLGLSLSSANDILTTGLLVFLFLSNKTGTGRLNHVLEKLIMNGLETGSLTCVGILVTMLCWVLASQVLIFLGLHFVMGKFYANSLLVTLNTRMNLHSHSRSACSCNETRGPIVFLEPRTPKATGKYLDGPSTTNKVPEDLQINVTVQTQMSVHRDYDAESISSM
ncbi:hypothetical protein C8R44DRAFT_979380 [Mycena epipterygia]|nr:hypothetical protein C8R44DRAFT_979380 [Mycena epipterygia]